MPGAVSATVQAAQASRQRIMDVALQCFIEQGVMATTINQVVVASGLSKGGVYHHFSSKQALIHAVIEQIFERVHHDSAKVFALPGTLQDRFAAMAEEAEVLIDGLFRHSKLMNDIYHLARHDDYVTDLSRRQYNAFLALLVAAIEEAKQKAEVAQQVDAQNLAMAIMGLMDSLHIACSIGTKTPAQMLTAISQGIHFMLRGAAQE